MRPPLASRPRRRPVRLTRRGRIVVLALCLMLSGAVVAVAAPSSRAADPPADPWVVVVLPGDTLWSVAARHVPSDDPYGMIREIRRLNDLPDHVIHAGQRLRLPPR